MTQLCPNIRLTWTSAHWFEEMCLGSSTYHSADFVSPLYHAVINRWENMIIFLLQRGASPQDTLPATRDTVVNALLKSMIDPEPTLLRLIEIATGLKIPHILAPQDLYTLLLHPHHAKQNLPRYDAEKLYYTCSIHWSADTSGYKLTWKRPEMTRKLGADLWVAIKKANDIQTSQINFANRRSHLMTLAVLQQNPTAVTCLLQLGMLPIRQRWNQCFFTFGPMDAIRPATAVPDSCCLTEGRELKRNLKEISGLLDPLLKNERRMAEKLFLYDSVPSFLYGCLLSFLPLGAVGWLACIGFLIYKLIWGELGFLNLLLTLFCLLFYVFSAWPLWLISLATFCLLEHLFFSVSDMLLGRTGQFRCDTNDIIVFDRIRLFTRGSELADFACGGSLASIYASSAGPFKQMFVRFILWHQGGWHVPNDSIYETRRCVSLYVESLIDQMCKAGELSTPMFPSENPFGDTEEREQQLSPGSTTLIKRIFGSWRREVPIPTVTTVPLMSGALEPGSHTNLQGSGAEGNFALSSPLPLVGRYWSLLTSRLIRPVRRRLPLQQGEFLESLADIPSGTDDIPLEDLLIAV